MKICMLIDSLDLGGGPEYIYQIARHQATNRFVVIAKGSTRGKLELLPNVEIVHGPSSSRLVNSFGPDIIHCNHTRSLLELYSGPGPGPAAPVVNTVHGVHLRKYEFRHGLAARAGFLLRRELERRLLRRATVNIMLTAADRDYARRAFGIGNMVVIPNGIDFSSLGGPGEAEPPEGAAGFRRRFLTIARFDFQKGYDVLLDAVGLEADRLRGAGAGFVWIGDGPELPAIRKLIERRSLGDLIRPVGPRAEAWKYLRGADCLVMPSRWEGFPLTLLEAGYFALPVIGSDTCGIDAVIEDGISGLLFANEDSAALARLLLRCATGEIPSGLGQRLRGRVLAENGIEGMSERVAEVYRSLSSSRT
jgi:glycosyltransferase involved in cell wall biosynthesis